MNNKNFIGSSLFTINLDFNYQFLKEKEDNLYNDALRLGRGFSHKKNVFNDVKELILPPIK